MIQGIKKIGLTFCVCVASLAAAPAAKADLSAESSYGFNWGNKTYVGGWVKNVGLLNYSKNQGRRVYLVFYYPNAPVGSRYELIMDRQISDIPAGQTRAFHVEINPLQADEQPIPILIISHAVTDINPYNDGTFETIWLGTF